MLTLRHDAKLSKAVCDVLVTLEKLRINTQFDIIQSWHSLQKLASRCCWNRALLLTCFISASLRRTDLQFGTPRRVRHFTWQQWGYFEICVVLMFVIQYMYKYLKRNMTDKRDQSVDFETILQCWKIVRTHYTKRGVRPKLVMVAWIISVRDM